MATKKVEDRLSILSGRPKPKKALSLAEQEVVSYKIPNDLRVRLEKLKIERVDSTFVRAAFVLLLNELEKQ